MAILFIIYIIEVRVCSKARFKVTLPSNMAPSLSLQNIVFTSGVFFTLEQLRQIKTWNVTSKRQVSAFKALNVDIAQKDQDKVGTIWVFSPSVREHGSLNFGGCVTVASMNHKSWLL